MTMTITLRALISGKERRRAAPRLLAHVREEMMQMKGINLVKNEAFITERSGRPTQGSAELKDNCLQVERFACQSEGVCAGCYTSELGAWWHSVTYSQSYGVKYINRV